MLSFRAAQLGTMALIQDTHINMPFQSWEMRPRDVNHAVLTIIAAIVEVEIQIKVSPCKEFVIVCVLSTLFWLSLFIYN